MEPYTSTDPQHLLILGINPHLFKFGIDPLHPHVTYDVLPDCLAVVVISRLAGLIIPIPQDPGQLDPETVTNNIATKVSEAETYLANEGGMRYFPAEERVMIFVVSQHVMSPGTDTIQVVRRALTQTHLQRSVIHWLEAPVFSGVPVRIFFDETSGASYFHIDGLPFPFRVYCGSIGGDESPPPPLNGNQSLFTILPNP